MELNKLFAPPVNPEPDQVYFILPEGAEYADLAVTSQEGQLVYVVDPSRFSNNPGSSITAEQGTTYYDTPNNYMYITFGVDGDWYAIRYRDNDENTGIQSGTKPTDLVTLRGLTYN